ncbi:ATP-binding protein [Actinoplanes sp. NPDC051475]|uniref:ATP-binding protein n=1 Tax=Actinoplanes sp. NPDC051475 TaxID=3157225 RepID=UPI00344BF5E3
MSDSARPGEVGPAGSGPAGAVPGVLLHQQFTEAEVSALRHAVTTAVATAGLRGEAAEDFVLAVHELVTNAVRHGGGGGSLELRLLADVLTCEIADDGGPCGGLPVRLSPIDRAGGRGLWLAHQLTGTLMLTRRPGGVTASVSACVTAQQSVSWPLTLSDADAPASLSASEDR